MYRVQYRKRASDVWQYTPAATLPEAHRIQASYRRQFWIAVVQHFNSTEQRWIG